MPTCTSSPVDVVDSTWRKRHQAIVARKSLVSSTVILLLLLIIYLDMTFHMISSYFDLNHKLWLIIGAVLAVIFMGQLCLNLMIFIQYIWACLFGGPVDLTEKQWRLLGIKENEPGFRTPPPQQKNELQLSSDKSLIFSTVQSSFSGGEGSPCSLIRSHSPDYSPSTSPVRYRSFCSSPSPIGTRAHSFDLHSSPSPYQYRGDRSLRSNRSYSPPSSASSSPYGCITDINTLHTYLQEQEDNEQRSRQAASPESLNSTASSFWSFGASAFDMTCTLRKYAYQLAPHSSQSPAKISSSDQMSLSGMDQVWSKLGVTEDKLYLWTERLRKWLSATIVSRLSNKISEINKTLQRIGCEDMQIGEVGVTTLKQLAMTKGNVVQSLNSLVPYLDFLSNQEYLVRRIQDLSTGSMSEFTWNKGGNYGKPWGEHLVTDAALIIHLLCTYLDLRLPTQPRFLDGKVFTSQHFIKTPDKPDLQRKDNLLIYQTNINPPHFQVIIGTETYNLPGGRNNMFHAILLFFFHVRKEGGMLGRINLGMSGLNILWIFD